MHKLRAVLLVGAVFALTACSGEGPSGAIRTAIADRQTAEQEAPPEQEVPEQEAPPEQEVPEQEAPPEQEVPEQEIPPDQEAPEAGIPVAEVEDGGDGVPTVLIVLGAALLLLLLLLAGWWRGRLSASAAEHSSWRDKAFEAYAYGAAIHDALAVQLSGTSAQTGPAQRDVEHRMSELTVQLHSLELTPPDAKTATALQEVLGAVAALRAASQADVNVRDSGAPDARRMEESTALARRRLAEFDATLTAFRAAL